ncbi:hypothetical protein Z517_02867 [Fonsecaea pedrosoi CBS 271.37]|uniref:Major facilitator superfamily (MFS) profile domain-containing protein n=1 Tax=Fonsecaea pedrosoi CBS 271.37 TaxID=1442368 RepID=A0A0D2E0Q0_9EURO|nr:uncharacterized protein Z517_02867 [Fonsecaea pedrosoi CBS 271.37]KIW83621.1 hypothetical protein Z517_02867 [Fonsecaea pedrosoi CBS 271.37]
MSPMPVAYFLPIILREGLEASLARAQCLTAPPHIPACIVMMVCGYLGDKYRIRSPMLVFYCWVPIIGLSLVSCMSLLILLSIAMGMLFHHKNKQADEKGIGIVG